MGFIKVSLLLIGIGYCIWLLLALIRISIQRFLFFIKLKKTAVKMGLLSIKTNPGWMLSWNKATKPSFIIETPDSIYVVKLCGALRKTDAYIFIDKSLWIKRRMIRGGKDLEIKLSPLVIDNKINLSYKTVKTVYLFLPKASIYFIRFGNQLTRILPGDVVYDGTVHDADSFLTSLRHDAERRQESYEVL